MLNDKPRITFIIPAYNRVSLLKKTLDSILKQKAIKAEIIVIDDASKVALKQKLKKHYPRVNFFRMRKNSGPSACRNFGLQKANAKFICFLDSDDLLKENFSLEMLKAANQNNSTVLCLSQALISKKISFSKKFLLFIFNIYRNAVLIYLYYFNNKKLLRSAFYAASTSRLVFPKRLILNNNFDKKLRSCEEWDLVLRILEKKKVIILTKKLLIFRFSQKSQTSIQRNKNNYQGYSNIISKLSWQERLHPFMISFLLYTKIIIKNNK